MGERYATGVTLPQRHAAACTHRASAPQRNAAACTHRASAPATLAARPQPPHAPAAHEVEDGLTRAHAGEAGGAIGHEALALRRANG